MAIDQESFDTWNKIAKLYEDKFMDLNLYNDTYDLFCAHVIKTNPSLLEIGCGPGNITKYMLSKRPDFKIEGIDTSPNMIALAKKNNPAANFKVMEASAISTFKTKFDAIICGFCLPYLSRTEGSNLVKNCSQLLLNNGVLYLSFVEGDYSKSGYLSGSSGDRTYFYYHHLDDIINELTQNYFDIINLTNKNYSKKDGTHEVHTILIASKLAVPDKR